MQRVIKRWVLVFSIGFFLSVSAFCISQTVFAKAGGASEREPIGTVNVFEINDLTGPTSDSCLQHHNGIFDTIRDVNESGGIAYNDPKTGKEERVMIKFNWGDNKAQAGPVPTLYNRLAGVKPKPVMYYGGSSAAVETTPPWTERDHIVQMSGPSGQKTWYPPRFSFTLTPDYPGQACAAAKWAMEDWRKKGHTEAPKWAWFTLDLPFGRTIIQKGSIDYIKKLGFEIVGTWTMSFTSVDVGPQIRSMISKGVNYAYGNVAFLQLQRVMKDMERLKVKDKLQYMACSSAISREDIMKEVGGSALDGVVGPHYTALPTEMEKPGVKEAYALCKKYNRPWSSDTLLSAYFGRVMVEALKRSLEKKGYPITGDDVFEAMIDPRGYESGGMMPKISFTKEERRGVWKVHMRRVEDGKAVRITEDFDLPNIPPQ